MTILPVNS